MNLKQMLVSSGVRGLVYSLVRSVPMPLRIAGVLLVALLAFFSPGANAQQLPVLCDPGNGGQANCTKAQAYAAANAYIGQWGQGMCEITGNSNSVMFSPSVVLVGSSSATSGRYNSRVRCNHVDYGYQTGVNVLGSHYFDSVCPAGQTWNAATNSCDAPNMCHLEPDGQPGMINGALTSTGVCKNGCKMVANLDPGGDDFTVADAAQSNAINFKRGTWVASGEQCDATNPEPLAPPDSPQGCHTTTSGHLVCRGEGKTCVTTPAGFKACNADPNAPVVAVNNARTEGASISAPNTPASTPVNRPGENWNSTGIGSITDNSTGAVTNVSSSSNNGTPNTGNPTPGDGSGEGEEPGDESGNAGPGLGDLYEKSDRTVESIATGFMSAVQETQLGQGITAVMDVQGSGSCPTFTVSASTYWETMTYSAHCEGGFLAFLQAAGWLIFAFASYRAVLIAVT